MTPSQKKIKTFANSLAVVLIALIFISVAVVVFLMTGGISLTNTLFGESSETEFSQVYENVENLEIDVNYANLNVVSGDSFKVDATYSDMIKVINVDNTLLIEEVSTLLEAGKNGSITVYIPDSVTLKEFKLDSDLAAVTVENIKCNELNVDVETGKTVINSVTATDKAEIESGTGEFVINSAELNNLSFDGGIGKATLSGRVYGASEIECGVGELNMILTGAAADYTIKGKAGTGIVVIDGNEVDGSFNLDGGSDLIHLKGGVGAVDISFQDKSAT